MNNIFVRRKDLDKAFDDMHKIKPAVSINFSNANKYTVRIEFRGKKADITEIMERGLTKSVEVSYNGHIYNCDSVLDAEKFVAELLK